MSPIEVIADGTTTVTSPTPEFVAEDVAADGTVTLWTSTPEFVTYEIGG